MLDEKDLEMLQTMMTQTVRDSESRMTEKMENSIAASEARMMARIEECAEDTRSQLMAYLESAIEPQIRRVAEGHGALNETKASNIRVDRLEEELSTHKSLILALGADVAKLKKAQ